MARTKAVLGAGARLSDFLSASLLARVVPPEAVHAVLDAHGCNTQRVRSFPAVAGVYYCMALSLYPEAAYEEVFAVVAQGLAWSSGAAEPALVGKSSISGSAQLASARRRWATSCERCCVPLAEARTHPQAFYAGLEAGGDRRQHLRVARRGRQRGRVSATPAAAQASSATPAIRRPAAPSWWSARRMPSWAPTSGPYRFGEWELCVPLLAAPGAGHALHGRPGLQRIRALAPSASHGRGVAVAMLGHPATAGADLLDDGSYLSVISPAGVGRAQAREQAIPVRVIEYAMPGADDAQPRYRLLTTLLDPKRGAGHGAGRAVPPALGDRGRLR